MTQPFDFADLVEEATERSGGETTTASDVYTLQRSLFLIQQDWMQKGYPTWRVETETYAINGVTPSLTLPEHVDDIMVINSVVGQSANEGSMKRITPDAYMGITTKSTEGRPSQWFLRRSEPPELFIYPIGYASQEVLLNVMYIRRPEEFERYQPDSDVPARWTRALVQALAVEMAKKRPKPDGSYDEALINRLTLEKAEAEGLAKGDDRDRAPYRVRISR